MLYILRPIQEMLSELDDQTSMQQTLIWRQTSMSMFLREMCTRRRRFSKMSLFMIWTWPIQDPKEDRTSTQS